MREFGQGQIPCQSDTKYQLNGQDAGRALAQLWPCRGWALKACGSSTGAVHARSQGAISRKQVAGMPAEGAHEQS